MKFIKLLFLFLFLPFVIKAQRSLTGLWTGALTNDSATIRQDQSFEIALSQYKQKITGYSRSTFIVNDTLYYIVKRVKGTIDGNVCEITDDKIVSYNFPGKLDKDVKVTITFHMNQQDSTWHLDGNWSTNKVKNKFYSISGKTDLKEEPDINKSTIFPHLEELNLADDITFYKEAKKPVQEVVSLPKSLPPVTENKKDTLISTKGDIADNKMVGGQKNSKIAEDAVIVKTNNDSSAITKSDGEQKKTEGLSMKEKAAEVIDSESPKHIESQPEIIVKAEQNKKTPAENKGQEELAVQSIQKEMKPVIPGAAIAVKERKTISNQEVTFKSDSLQLALYDNGEIDGDTVSVLLDGEIILAKQGLKATAIRKTIYIEPGKDELTLVLYAENLGKYPPNTGLLIVYDGEDSVSTSV